MFELNLVPDAQYLFPYPELIDSSFVFDMGSAAFVRSVGKSSEKAGLLFQIHATCLLTHGPSDTLSIHNINYIAIRCSLWQFRSFQSHMFRPVSYPVPQIILLIANIRTIVCQDYITLLEKCPTFSFRKPNEFQWSALAWDNLEPSYACVNFFRM